MNRKPLILTALLVAAFAVNLDTTMVNVALPALERELGSSTTQLQWVVDAYNLVFAALLLGAGNLSDRLGRRPMLVAGLAVFGLASAAGAMTNSSGALIVTRAVMGLGAAMTFPATLSLLTDVFVERRERAMAIGLWGASGGVAIALGPIVGGWLLAHYSWASIFWAMAPVALVAIALVLLVVPNPRSTHPAHFDAAGLATSAAAMALLVFTIIEAPTYGWGSLRTLGGFVIAGALLWLFVNRERRSDAPMIDVRLFSNPRFSAASGAVTVAFFTLFGFIFLMTQFFQFIRGYSALSTGVHLLPVATSVAVGSVAGTALAVRYGTKLVVTVGLLLVTTFYLWVAGSVDPGLGYSTIAMQMVVYGLGMGFTSAPATESIMGAVSRRQAGVGSAVNDTTRLVGGTLGVAVIGSIYASLYQHRLGTLANAGVPHQLISTMQQSVAAGLEVSAKVAASGHVALANQMLATTTSAFVHGLRVSCLVAGLIALVGAAATAVYLPSKPAGDDVNLEDSSVTDDAQPAVSTRRLRRPLSSTSSFAREGFWRIEYRAPSTVTYCL